MEAETTFSGDLGRLIQSEVDSVRSYSALEVAITSAAGIGGAVVSRKQLKSIAKGDPARLSTEQLDALDAYFRATRSRSLMSLLAEYNRLLSTVARCSEARFMLGERPSGIREGLSLSKWDFDSMAAFLQAMYALERSGNLKLRFSEAGMEVKAVTSECYERRFKEAEWHQNLLEDTFPTICLGSPRSCHGAEVIIAKMFGVQAFARTPAKDLPFYFGWVRDDFFPHGCSFVQHREPSGGQQYPWENRSINIPGDRDYVIRSEDATGKTWISYGITAVQRLPPPLGLRAVFCGLSGPETRGTVGAAGQMEVPPLVDGGNSAVAWALSETIFELKNPGSKNSARRFKSSQVVRHGVWQRD